jgi:hypothetical protein
LSFTLSPLCSARIVCGARAVFIAESLVTIQFSIIYQPIEMGSHFLQFNYKMQIRPTAPIAKEQPNRDNAWVLLLSMLPDFFFFTDKAKRNFNEIERWKNQQKLHTLCIFSINTVFALRSHDSRFEFLILPFMKMFSYANQQ